ncbi:MAG TPA: deoxyribodipyrimidine photo-lyase [Leptospiraceae bacterium]|nr:DNA photolyase family protein [Leptospirales bacterium]HMW58536.1 deoxyribodipyrimidine photo-lyase [Leptospiraceae bacterium]HMY43947.1 deoxyribodipyrimidine photo-lyase [Leptospiraceae bacterium]HNE22931.1 deoxyribodipyrimidine photo-lyase [Leptospiraceae bacterium]HNJ35824.1 deoxyribodipyrimidine photo-lyase [Leptospiraceae bacterium]
MKETAFFWFRRDLRLKDNSGLFHALSSGLAVIPVFIFDTNILENLPRDDARVTFIHSVLTRLKTFLESKGSTILVMHGDPLTVWKELIAKHKPRAIFANHDYESYAIERDQKISEICKSSGVDFKTTKDQCIFEKSEVVKDSGEPYTVFTPYFRKWKVRLESFDMTAFPSEKRLERMARLPASKMPGLDQLGFVPSSIRIEDPSIPENIIASYAETRDYPSLRGTTHLGVHLRFGTLSIRTLAKSAQKSQVFLSELAWRDFFMMILYHFPHSATRSFKPQYDRIVWRNNENEFEAWKEGRTGYPLVDAGMRELVQTGFMHNRVRMVTASFLCKHLLIDWRKGERFFAEKLLDYDLSANVGNWQWACGSGCDAAPYFRIFNPSAQEKKFDPDRAYIKQWIGELSSSYPEPIVKHELARDRCLKVFKEALAK